MFSSDTKMPFRRSIRIEIKRKLIHKGIGIRIGNPIRFTGWNVNKRILISIFFIGKRR